MTMTKKELLFNLKNHIKFLTKENLQEILNRAISCEHLGNNIVFLILKNELPSSIKIYSGGDQEWRCGEKTVKIHKNGDQKTYKNGYLHSFNDKPAVLCVYGYKEWYKNDRLHKEDGLARINPYGDDEYWMGGMNLGAIFKWWDTGKAKKNFN